MREREGNCSPPTILFRTPQFSRSQREENPLRVIFLMNYHCGQIQLARPFRVVHSADVHRVKSLFEEVETDSSVDEMPEDEPAEQGIGKRVIGENGPWGMGGSFALER